MRTIIAMRLSAAVAVVGLAAWGAVARAQMTEDDGYRTKAEVQIGLPSGVEPEVSVMPGSRRVVVELPEGSRFPVDFTSSTGGLVRNSEVTTLEDGRTRLTLDLAMGLLDRVIYTPEGVTLRFNSRFEVQDRLSGDDETQYHLGPDDEIVVTVHGHSDLTSELTVTDGGYITAPLVGDVKAEGLTPSQLASRLAELLGRDYLVDPQVDVDVESFESQWVMVAGEIRIPGRVSLRGGTRLKEVLSEAGGFGSDSGELITITRKSGNDDEVSFTIDRSDFEDGVKNPVLRNGDIVTISKAKYAYLQGEVSSPSRVRIERDTTLMKALAQVGGLTDWANRKQVQIIPEAGGAPKVFNLKDIQRGKSPDPPLYGGEIVIVKRRFF